MVKLKSHFDFPFNKDIPSKALPLIIGIVIYVATIAVISMLFTGQTVIGWNKWLSNRITLEIPHNTIKNNPNVLEELSTVLRREKNKIAFIQLSDAKKVKEIVANATQDPKLAENIPVPAFVDIHLYSGQNLDNANLRNIINGISPNISIYNHKDWYRPVINVIDSIKSFSAWLVILMTLLLAVLTSFMTYSILIKHKRIAYILRLIGAPNKYIANQFSRYAVGVGFKSGILSIALGGFTLLFIGFMIYGGLVNVLTCSLVVWISVFVMPVLVALLIYQVSKITILWSLNNDENLESDNC